MLTKTVAPKSKAELIRALQAASFRSFEIYECTNLTSLPSADRLRRGNGTVIVLTP